MTKVKVLLPFVREKESFGIGETTSLPQMVAYSFAKKGVVEFVTKKQFTELDAKISKEKEEQKIKEDEEQKRVAAIQNKEVLESERAKLQVRVDEITNALDDGAVYYKTYASLASDLSQGEGEK